MISETDMTLACDLTSQWVGGWFYQEKIRDCRVMWDGEVFWTRSGAIVDAPDWFTKGLPNMRIDGGIWAGRHGFQIASNAVRLGGHHWDEPDIAFTPFDLPDMVATWDLRQREASRAIKGCACARSIPFGRVDDINRTELTPSSFGGVMMRVAKLGGEGVVFRNPICERYETGRSPNLLRNKLTAN